MTAAGTLRLQATASAQYQSGGSILFVGKATMPVRVAGFTFLTDSTFIHRHEQTRLGFGSETIRLTDPATDLADLPPLDFVLHSHFHGDHFDQAAETGLRRPLPLVTAPESAEAVRDRGYRSLYPLARWDTVVVETGGARPRITAPAHHGPPVADLTLPEVRPLGSPPAIHRPFAIVRPVTRHTSLGAKPADGDGSRRGDFSLGRHNGSWPVRRRWSRSAS